jgi:hypothetical protein
MAMSNRKFFFKFGISERGTAMLEMAILSPMYLLLLFGLIYLGYSAMAGHKEQIASAYAALQPGAQTADEMMPRFFGWNPRVDRTNPAANGGTEAHAGDVTLRVFDGAGTSSLVGGAGAGFYSVDHFNLALWVMQLGEVVGHYDPRTRQTVIETFRDQFGQYIFDNDIVNPDSAHSTTAYTQDAANILNSDPYNRSWLERRRAQLEYVYEPFFRGRVAGSQPLTDRQFYSYAAPPSEAAPIYSGVHQIAARGPGERLGANDPGESADNVLTEVSRMTGGALPAPMSNAGRDDLGRIYWPNKPNIWIAR